MYFNNIYFFLSLKEKEVEKKREDSTKGRKL